MYRYILRFSMDPGFQENERWGNLFDFCKKADIDEVMFLINVEALNRGHLSYEETELWMDMIKRGKKHLDCLKVETSLNPWTTLNHADRGRKLKSGQEFTLMVGHDGTEATAQVCPLCPEWRKYFVNTYGIYASIRPHVLWIEDDFRLHNHKPIEFGCFCRLHMKEYSTRAGRELSREEFLAGVLQPGKPHPFRKIWLDTARDAFSTVAVMIRDKVREISPDTRMGLMTSNPSVHCAEGRDWEGLFKSLDGKYSPHNRIYMPAYKEPTSQKFLLDVSRVSRLTRAFEPAWVEVYPELASYRGYRFAKSREFIRGQLELGCVIDQKGMTFNIYDMLGNGILPEEGYQETMACVKPYIHAIMSTGIDSSLLTGVKIPVSSESSYSIDTAYTGGGSSINGISPEETMFCQLLTAYGITNKYTTKKKHQKSIIAISGQYLRNLEKDEIIRLFEDNYIIMEGDAVITLYDMNLSHLAGIEEIEVVLENTGTVSYEEVCDGNRYCSITQARLPAQVAVGDYVRMSYSEGFVPFSIMKSYMGNVTGPGMGIYDKRVLILPYCCSAGNFDFHLNTIRQALFKKALSMLPEGYSKPSSTEGNPYLALYEYEFDNKTVFLIYNASSDHVDDIVIESEVFNHHIKALKTVLRSGEITDIEDYSQKGMVIHTGLGVGRMQIKSLIIEY